MKTSIIRISLRHSAFTLIELLVVISILAVLATLVITGGGKIMENSKASKAKAELKQVAAMIDQYKLKFGYYPPDNSGNFKSNSLYFELLGVTYNPTNTIFTTLDGAAEVSAANCQTTFGVGAILNCTKASGDDVGKPAIPFLVKQKPNQYYELSAPAKARILVCSVQWPEKYGDVITGVPLVNPWRYRVTGATNNPGSYDLWVDIIVSGKTNRISNWSDKPEVY